MVNFGVFGAQKKKENQEEHAEPISTTEAAIKSKQKMARKKEIIIEREKERETHSAFNPTLLSSSDQTALYFSFPPTTCPASQTPPLELLFAPNSAALTPSKNT